MDHAKHRSVLVALGLVTALAFAACSGLDDRKVTRGPDVPAGGDGSGNTGNTGNTGNGNTPGVGGSDSLGGDGNSNPFGGDTFTGGAPPSVDGPPEVLEVDPAVDADEVAPSTAVSLLFSEGLDAATVTPDSIKLLDGDREVAGEVSYEGVVSTFDPTSRLSLLATYDVTVSTDVTDAGGQPLKEAFASKFTVREGVWDRQGSVAEDPTSVSGHASGIDAQGNMLVAYTRALTPATPNVRTAAARWVNASTGLREEVPLEDNGLSCGSVKVAVDPEGNAIVIWQVSDAKGQATLRGRRYVNGEWERSPQNVAQDGAAATMSSADSSAVAIGAGQVVVAWTRYFYQTSGNYVVNYTSTTVDGAWPAQPSAPIAAVNSSPKYEYLDNLQAAVDVRGTALVTFVWHSSTGAYQGVYFARRAPGMDWEYPTKIPSSSVPGAGTSPALASDGEGAMAVWFDYINYEYRLRASRYTKAKQFEAPIEIGDPQVVGNARLRARGLATDGNSFWVAWTQALGSSDNVYVKRYDIATSAWDAEPTLVSDGVANAEVATIGVDAHGNALVTYDQRAANNTLLVMGVRYVAGTGRWSDPTPLTEAATYFNTPSLSVAGNGVAGVLYSSQENEGMPDAKDMSGVYRIFK